MAFCISDENLFKAVCILDRISVVISDFNEATLLSTSCLVYDDPFFRHNHEDGVFHNLYKTFFMYCLYKLFQITPISFFF